MDKKSVFRRPHCDGTRSPPPLKPSSMCPERRMNTYGQFGGNSIVPRRRAVGDPCRHRPASESVRCAANFRIDGTYHRQ
jgi:hypothetical protein